MTRDVITIAIALLTDAVTMQRQIGLRILLPAKAEESAMKSLRGILACALTVELGVGAVVV